MESVAEPGERYSLTPDESESQSAIAAIVAGAVALTGEMNPEAAAQRLFADPELQAQILARLADPAIRGSIAPEVLRELRVSELRTLATRDGCIPVSSLGTNEKLTLVFESQGWLSRKPRRTFVGLVRPRVSENPESQRLLVAANYGDRPLSSNIHGPLPVGAAVFFGCREAKSFRMEFRLGTMPVRVSRMSADGQSYDPGSLVSYPDYTLTQVCYGSGEDYPLFNE